MSERILNPKSGVMHIPVGFNSDKGHIIGRKNKTKCGTEAPYYPIYVHPSWIKADDCKRCFSYEFIKVKR